MCLMMIDRMPKGIWLPKDATQQLQQQNKKKKIVRAIFILQHTIITFKRKRIDGLIIAIFQIRRQTNAKRIHTGS